MKKNKIPKGLDIEEMVEREERRLAKIQEEERKEQEKLERIKQEKEMLEKMEERQNEMERQIEEQKKKMYSEMEEQETETLQQEEKLSLEEIDRMIDFKEKLKLQKSNSTHKRAPATEKKIQGYNARKDAQEAEEKRREALLKGMDRLEKQEER